VWYFFTLFIFLMYEAKQERVSCHAV